MGYGGGSGPGGGDGGGSGYSAGGGGSSGSGYRRVGEDRTANFKVNNITSRDKKSGTKIDGIVEVNSTNHFVPPSGSTTKRGATSRYVTDEIIPTDGLKILLDGGDIESNNPDNPELIWRNISGTEDYSATFDFYSGGIKRHRGPRGSIELPGSGTKSAMSMEQYTTNIFDAGAGTVFVVINPHLVNVRQTMFSGYIASGPGQPNRWDFEINSSAQFTGGNHDDTYTTVTSPTAVANKWVTFAVTLNVGEFEAPAKVNDVSTFSSESQRYNIQRMYVNGTYTTVRKQGTNRTWQSGTWLSFGARSYNTDEFEFNGEFGFVAAYNRALSHTEILQLHNAVKDTYGI